MDSTEKLLRKISRDDRIALNKLTDDLQDPHVRKSMDILKLAGGDFFRVRKGKFRAIFHFEGKSAVIDAIRFRSEKTYRDLWGLVGFSLSLSHKSPITHPSFPKNLPLRCSLLRLPPGRARTATRLFCGVRSATAGVFSEKSADFYAYHKRAE